MQQQQEPSTPTIQEAISNTPTTPTTPTTTQKNKPNEFIVAQASRYIYSLYEYNSKLTGHTVLLSQQDIQYQVYRYLEKLEQAGYKKKEQGQAVELFNKQLANLYKEEGNKYLKNKKFATAVDLYISACLIAPEQAVYYSNLASALFFCKRVEESEQACSFAIMLDPNYSKAYSRMAKVKETLNKYEEAIRNYEKAIELESSQSVKETLIKQVNELKLKMNK
ncbi:predicted protein [Naegleria gruberi]|uniref:Predicted protein n=1 Tax=Naegleria gruberi TaxID=5762 RepID=D2W2C3_NAEGR|nr:uncharacterized protein NAEGRDRAFT_82125 [Naegleria gruberi]EFC36837.1 predicted protein [Naegleria gruberi]|eukprot:XP_002669581.1 predicted protein [Naegleria gruberi strain NEG-M]